MSTSRPCLTRPLGLLVALVFSLAPAVSHAAEGDGFAEALGRGPLHAAGVALLGGLLVSLTPCVYPMIAITVAVFGARKSEGRLHGLMLSSAFVLGIIAMFTPLGVVAGLTGSLFGSVLQNPWVLVGIATLFLGMAASMFGAFEVALPAALTNRLARVGGMGARGAFALGLVTGLIAAPCTGPVLTGILAFIAQSQSAALGALAMGAFSLGLGLPFLLVGTFAVQLPKSGRWMLHVKSVLAILLAVVALYYLVTAFPALGAWVRPSATLSAVCAAGLLGGLAFGAVHRDFASPLLEDRLGKSVGAALVTVSALVLVLAITTPERSLRWAPLPLTEARERALAERRPLLVDVSAAWCGACKELDKLTFADPAVSRAAGRFVAVKLDATDEGDPAVQASLADLRVLGLPTVVLLDSSGREARRFTEFVPPAEFLQALEQVR